MNLDVDALAASSSGAPVPCEGAQLRRDSSRPHDPSAPCLIARGGRREGAPATVSQPAPSPPRCHDAGPLSAPERTWPAARPLREPSAAWPPSRSSCPRGPRQSQGECRTSARWPPGRRREADWDVLCAQQEARRSNHGETLACLTSQELCRALVLGAPQDRQRVLCTLSLHPRTPLVFFARVSPAADPRFCSASWGHGSGRSAGHRVPGSAGGGGGGTATGRGASEPREAHGRRSGGAAAQTARAAPAGRSRVRAGMGIADDACRDSRLRRRGHGNPPCPDGGRGRPR